MTLKPGSTEGAAVGLLSRGVKVERMGWPGFEPDGWGRVPGVPALGKEFLTRCGADNSRDQRADGSRRRAGTGRARTRARAAHSQGGP